MNHSLPPRLSVIMVDGSFRERFESIDFFGRQTLERDDYELIWVEYFDRVRPDLAERIARYPNFRVITLGRSGPYHSSYCFNRGIVEARGDVIAIPDGDVIVEQGFLHAVLRDHEATDRLVEYFHRYNESRADHREPIEIDHLRRVCKLTNPANHGACLSVRKRWLLEINGYDQHPTFSTGFHCNDRDVYTRLTSLGLLVRWSPDQKLYHPWHESTAVHSPHYLPQQRVIAWRGCELKTLPFRGIDPSKDSDPPAGLARELAWIREQHLPLKDRVKVKLRRKLRLAA